MAPCYEGVLVAAAPGTYACMHLWSLELIFKLLDEEEIQTLESLRENKIYAGALDLYQKVLKFQQRHVGCEDLDVAETKICLRACVRTRMHVLACACEGFLQASIANVMQQQGQLQAALEKYGEAPPVLEAKGGRNHPSVAATYGNMGLTYDLMGDFPKALESVPQS